MKGPGNPNINEVNKKTQFTKDNQPKNKGRRPSSLKKYYKENKVSATDKVLLFDNILSKFTPTDLMLMIKTKKFPDGKEMSGLLWGFIVAWAADIKRGFSSGGINTMMMERRHGKIPEKIELKADVNYSELSEEDVKKRLDELLAKREAEIEQDRKDEEQDD